VCHFESLKGFTWMRLIARLDSSVCHSPCGHHVVYLVAIGEGVGVCLNIPGFASLLPVLGSVSPYETA
jgi:hypothetical protein